MTAEPEEIHLREPGMGIVVGGVALILANQVLDPMVAAVIVAILGAGYIVVGPLDVDPRRLGAGIVLVGLIGLIESSAFGLGFEPLVIGFFAIAFGMFDVVLGLVYGRVRRRRR